MASDIFFEIEGGPKGESTDSKFKEAIEILAVKFGGENPSTIKSGSKGAGGKKCTIHKLLLTKNTDSSSADLFQAMCQGKHWPKATLRLRKPGGGDEPLEYFTLELSTVFLDSIEFEADDNGESHELKEKLHVSFGKIQLSYTPQTESGEGGSPMTGGWNITENAPA